MKKTINLLLAFILCILLFGCSLESPSAEPHPSGTPAATQTQAIETAIAQTQTPVETSAYPGQINACNVVSSAEAFLKEEFQMTFKDIPEEELKESFQTIYGQQLAIWGRECGPDRYIFFVNEEDDHIIGPAENDMSMEQWYSRGIEFWKLTEDEAKQYAEKYGLKFNMYIDGPVGVIHFYGEDSQVNIAALIRGYCMGYYFTYIPQPDDDALKINREG